MNMLNSLSITWFKNIENKNNQDNVKKWVQSILHPEIITKINIEEAKIIANWIIEENKTHKHMIEKTPTQIMQEINSWLWVVAKINGEIVGSMSMIEINLENSKKMYEAGSLITNPKKRGLWIAKVLTKEIFIQNMEKAVYSITEVPWVMHIYSDILKLKELTKFDLEKNVLEEIESVWALLPTDKIYWNKAFLALNK